MRVDIWLVENGLAPSRARAQELIAKGRVFLLEGEKRKPISKPSFRVTPDLRSAVQIAEDPEADRFVSRGGVKMQGALERTRLAVAGSVVLDIGQSTGGFTDCVLQAGASRVVGVDVGHGQLAAKLKEDPRVVQVEGLNARDLGSVPLLRLNDGQKFDLIVIDVSFISLALVLPDAIQYLKESGRLLALVKPQFEVGREGLGKNGIVKNPALYGEVENKIRAACASAGLAVEDYFASSIEGGDGNREFFVYARPSQLSLV